MRISDWSSDVCSSDLVSAYVYTSAGPGESSTDLSWDGQSMIYELGDELAQSERFRDQGDILYADIDVQRLRLERLRSGSSEARCVGKECVRTCRSRWLADQEINK